LQTGNSKQQRTNTNVNLATKPTRQWGTTTTTTTTIGKQETSQQATSKQQPVNQERRQRTISPIFTADNIAEEKIKDENVLQQACQAMQECNRKTETHR
jgi:hypothetical protein